MSLTSLKYEIRQAYCQQCLFELICELKETHPGWFDGDKIRNTFEFQRVIQMHKAMLFHECFVYEPENIRGIALCLQHLLNISTELKQRKLARVRKKYKEPVSS
jgi:hypothetical protein